MGAATLKPGDISIEAKRGHFHRGRTGPSSRLSSLDSLRTARAAFRLLPRRRSLGMPRAIIEAKIVNALAVLATIARRISEGFEPLAARSAAAWSPAAGRKRWPCWTVWKAPQSGIAFQLRRRAHEASHRIAGSEQLRDKSPADIAGSPRYGNALQFRNPLGLEPFFSLSERRFDFCASPRPDPRGFRQNANQPT